MGSYYEVECEHAEEHDAIDGCAVCALKTQLAEAREENKRLCEALCVTCLEERSKCAVGCLDKDICSGEDGYRAWKAKKGRE